MCLYPSEFTAQPFLHFEISCLSVKIHQSNAHYSLRPDKEERKELWDVMNAIRFFNHVEAQSCLNVLFSNRGNVFKGSISSLVSVGRSR